VLDGRGDQLSTIETPTARILPQLGDHQTHAQPDVVVLDLDHDEGADLARTIADQFPSIKVIACSADSPTMKVFPPFHSGESYDVALNPTQLIYTVLH